jgi:hypothetical protein
MSKHRIDNLPLDRVLEMMGVSQRQAAGYSTHFSQSGLSRISHKTLSELTYEEAVDITKAIVEAVKAEHPALKVEAEIVVQSIAVSLE